MDVNKNSYTIGFAAIMVIIVSALLSSASIGLKPFQAKNVEQEKKQNILKSVGVDVSREQAAIIYSDYIKQQLVLNSKGEVKEGKSAFNVNLAKEVKKNITDQDLPIYIAEVDGETKYIIPLRGKGLWGPIWGFISLNDDLNTISAAVFAHKSETPGLGAEINTATFQDPFTGKTIFEGVTFTSVAVVKNIKNENNQVNGISGGTITSDGVSKMIEERLSKYLLYFESLSPKMQVENAVNIVDIDENSDTTSNINKRITD